MYYVPYYGSLLFLLQNLVRLNVVQTLFGKDIAFSVRTFKFTTDDGTPGVQEQTISCELHLESAADVTQEQASDCTCYDEEDCAG